MLHVTCLFIDFMKDKHYFQHPNHFWISIIINSFYITPQITYKVCLHILTLYSRVVIVLHSSRFSPVPCGPSNVQVNVNCASGAVNISWDAQRKAEGYIAVISDANRTMTQYNTTQPRLSIGSKDCGQEYTVKVMSYNRSCVSFPSETYFNEGERSRFWYDRWNDRLGLTDWSDQRFYPPASSVCAHQPGGEQKLWAEVCGRDVAVEPRSPELQCDRSGRPGQPLDVRFRRSVVPTGRRQV